MRDVQTQRCWKRGSGDGQRLKDYCTTERSFNAVSALCVAVERRGSTLTSTICKGYRRQPIAKSGKFVWCACLSWTALDCKKRTVLCFLPSWITLPFERGFALGKRERFDVTARSDKSHKQRQVHRAVAQVKESMRKRRTASTEPISKKVIKLRGAWRDHRFPEPLS